MNLFHGNVKIQSTDLHQYNHTYTPVIPDIHMPDLQHHLLTIPRHLNQYIRELCVLTQLARSPPPL